MTFYRTRTHVTRYGRWRRRLWQPSVRLLDRGPWWVRRQEAG